MKWVESALSVVRDSPFKIILKPLAQKIPLPVLKRLPPQLLNETHFSGLYSINLPGSRRLIIRSHWAATALARDGLASSGGEAIRVFLQLLPHVKSVIDVGANFGLYTLLARAADVPRVHAFEPVPAIFEQLQENLRLNALEASCHQVAVSKATEDTLIYVVSDEAAAVDASLRQEHRRNTHAIPVRTITLDGLDALQGLRIDLIKIDTEGTEPDVLAGAASLLARDKPIILCEVLAGLIERQVHELLDPLGYRYYWLTDTGLVRQERIVGDPAYKNLNYLFVPAEREALVSSLR